MRCSILTVSNELFNNDKETLLNVFLLKMKMNIIIILIIIIMNFINIFIVGNYFLKFYIIFK